MSGKWNSWFLPVCLALNGCWATASNAAIPFESLLTPKRVDANPDKDYQLSNGNGPWMIMASSFSGKGAEEQARELVYELRKRYKLEAYTYQMRFDFSDVRGRGLGQFGSPVQMRYRRGSAIEEIAVLVGNYQAVDDPEAQKTLSKLKYARPKCLELDESRPTSRTLAAWRLYARFASPESQKKGPMGKAFVTTNPLLPREYFNAPGIDPLVVRMNQDVPHSLLDCPGKYTVQVATFKGQVIIVQKEIQAIEEGKKMESQLAKAAQKAHELTEALRLKGWEAYEFHDRYASIVTVGSFDSVGTTRPDGLIEMDPRIQTIMASFRGQPTNGPTPSGTLSTNVRMLVGIPFDAQPVLVQVPQRSIGHEMARRRD